MDRFDLRVGATHSNFYSAAFTETTHQLQVHIRPACSRLAINGNDLLTRHQTGLGSQTAALLPMSALTALIVWRHRGNLRDLMAGRTRIYSGVT